MNDFGDLRSLLHGAPSLERFHALVTLIESSQRACEEGWLTYAEQYLHNHWPDHLRACPQERLKELEDQKVIWSSLVRHLNYEGQHLTPKRFQKLLDSEHLSHVTCLDMKACRFAWQDLLNLAQVAPFESLQGFAMRKSSSSGADAAAIKELFHSKMLTNLAHLSFDGWSGIKPVVYEITAQAPFLKTLKSLNLSGCKVSTKRFKELMCQPELCGLKTFHMSNQNKNTPPGRMQVLAEMTHFSGLEDVDIADFSEEELVMFSRARHLSGLRKLRLALHDSLSNDDPVLDDAALIELFQTPVVTRLESLTLDMNLLKSATIASLMSAPAMQSLEHLTIKSRSYSNWGLHRPDGPDYEGYMEALATSSLLNRLRTLRLVHLSSEEDAFQEVICSDKVSSLEELVLTDHNLNMTHADALLSSPHLQRLRILTIIYGSFSLQQLCAFARSENFPNIETIHLYNLRGLESDALQQFEKMVAEGAFPGRQIECSRVYHSHVTIRFSRGYD